jgi:hypothetical protein
LTSAWQPDKVVALNDKEKTMASKTEIVEYIVRQGKRRAILYAGVCGDDKYGITFAMCHKRDAFKRAEGLNICRSRLARWAENPTKWRGIYPHTLEKEITKFMGRCSRFFKGKTMAYPLTVQPRDGESKTGHAYYTTEVVHIDRDDDWFY